MKTQSFLVVALGLFVTAALTLTACSGGGSDKVCEPGRQLYCSCGTYTGFQTCADDGAGWGMCQCDCQTDCAGKVCGDDGCGGTCAPGCLGVEQCVSGQCECPDVDRDGHEHPDCGGTDCDDFEQTIYPGAPEICSDGIDQDCDGIDPVCNCDDLDGDGHYDTQCGGDDCDDGDPDTYPGASETCGDGIDQDCSGRDLQCGCADADSDGFSDIQCGGTDCDDQNAGVNPGIHEIPDNGVDDDCNPDTSDITNPDCELPSLDCSQEGLANQGRDRDFDLWGECCDCDDSDERVHPNANEIIYNLKDDDCDPNTPDSDLDGDGYEADVVGGPDCDDRDDGVYPGALEICDGNDNDCDGQTDEDLVLSACLIENEFGTCDGVEACQGIDGLVCEGRTPAAELCNQIDEDCDGLTDEDFFDDIPCDGVGECGIGTYECLDEQTAICSTEPGGSQDESVDEHCDTLDNDCDGLTDEDDVCGSGGGSNTCGNGTCDAHEDAESCSQDCAIASCAAGGTTACEPELGENCSNCAQCGTCYFVSASGSDGNDGLSASTAWQHFEHAIENIAFGDDIYLRAGDTWLGSAYVLAHSGTADNTTVYGAYYELGGTEYLGLRNTQAVTDARPILRGSDSHASNLGVFPAYYEYDWDARVYTPTTLNPSGERGNCGGNQFDARGLCSFVEISGDYVTFQDIEITNTWGRGLRTKAADAHPTSHHVAILRTKVHRTGSGGILIYSDDTLVEQCDVSLTGMHWDDFAGWEAWFPGDPGAAENNSRECSQGGWPSALTSYAYRTTIRKNRVGDTITEGINFWKGSFDGVAEFNVVSNTGSVGIYVDGGQGADVRHNLVVGTTDPEHVRLCGDQHRETFYNWHGGIVVTNEDYTNRPPHDTTIRGNVVVGAGTGITISNHDYDPNADDSKPTTNGVAIDNLQVYNNTLIDNRNNMKLQAFRDSVPGCAFNNAKIKNNVSYLSAECISSFGCSQQTMSYGNRFGECADWDYGNNLWVATPAPSQLSHASDTTWNGSEPLLTRLLGWLFVGSTHDVITSDFFPAPGSVFAGAGEDLIGYDTQMGPATDFLAIPIVDDTVTQSGPWDVGACKVSD